MNKKTVLVRHENDTKKIAIEFAKSLQKGDVVELIGDVGSGKTFFTKALCKALGAEGASSPSFVIKNEYVGNKFKILHFDFYRLDYPDIVSEELNEGISAGESLIIIEWAKTIENTLPDDRRKIYFKVTGDNSRELTICR